MDLNLELDKAKQVILDNNARSVIIQLPDGLKPKAQEITDFLQQNTSAKITIWAGSCFGACDTPDLPQYDLLIQWGHSAWKK